MGLRLVGSADCLPVLLPVLPGTKGGPRQLPSGHGIHGANGAGRQLALLKQHKI